MIRGDKELFVVGDRVLIRLDDREERTAVGLYLPPTALEREDVQSGRIEEVGPGLVLPPREMRMELLGVKTAVSRSAIFPTGKKR